jgi:hypothetical protein
MDRTNGLEQTASTTLSVNELLQHSCHISNPTLALADTFV